MYNYYKYIDVLSFIFHVHLSNTYAQYVYNRLFDITATCTNSEGHYMAYIKTSEQTPCVFYFFCLWYTFYSIEQDASNACDMWTWQSIHNLKISQ